MQLSFAKRTPAAALVMLSTLSLGVVLTHVAQAAPALGAVAAASAASVTPTSLQGLKWVETKDAGSATELPSSVFAVVIAKAGIASGFAHNHFIRASNYTLELKPGASPTLPQEVRMSFAAQDLIVDDPDVIAAAGKRLKTLGIAHAEFTALEKSDRDTIRKNMLAADQLAGEEFPRLEIVATNFRSEEGKMGTEKSNVMADVTFTIRGKSVKKSMPLSVNEVPVKSAEGTHAAAPLTIEGLTSARFEEFGFKAYSGLLGAVRNQEEFQFYFRTQGQWKP